MGNVLSDWELVLVNFSILCLMISLGVMAYLRYELTKSKRREFELRMELREQNTVYEQLDHHFLFNALNTIRYFLRTDANQAREMLLDLAQVLQAIHRRSKTSTLIDELESGRAYLRLEQARLGERLRVEDNITEPIADVQVRSHTLSPILKMLVTSATQRTAGGLLRLAMTSNKLVAEGDGVADTSTGVLDMERKDLIVAVEEQKTTFEWSFDQL